MQAVQTGDMGNRCARTWVTQWSSGSEELPMPWREHTIMSERIEFIQQAEQAAKAVVISASNTRRRIIYGKWISKAISP